MAFEVDRFTDYHRADIELPDQTRAIPAGRQCRHQNLVAIVGLATGFTKGVGFAVDGRVVVLHPAIAAASEQIAMSVEQRRADRYAAFIKTGLRFGERHSQHVCIVHREISSVGIGL